VEEIVIQAGEGAFSAAELKKLARAIEKVHPLIEASVENASGTHESDIDTVFLWTPWKKAAPARADESMKVALGWARGRASRSGQGQRVVMLGADSKLLQALDLSWPNRKLSDPTSDFKPPGKSRDPRRASDK
jgi:hypothetical protein